MTDSLRKVFLQKVELPKTEESDQFKRCLTICGLPKLLSAGMRFQFRSNRDQSFCEFLAERLKHAAPEHTTFGDKEKKELKKCAAAVRWLGKDTQQKIYKNLSTNSSQPVPAADNIQYWCESLRLKIKVAQSSTTQSSAQSTSSTPSSTSIEPPPSTLSSASIKSPPSTQSPAPPDIDDANINTKVQVSPIEKIKPINNKAEFQDRMCATIPPGDILAKNAITELINSCEDDNWNQFQDCYNRFEKALTDLLCIQDKDEFETTLTEKNAEIFTLYRRLFELMSPKTTDYHSVYDRYKNVLPAQATLVQIPSREDNKLGYIHANRINSRVIAMQGPLEETTKDVYELFRQEKCNVAISIGEPIVEGREKFFPWWEQTKSPGYTVQSIRQETIDTTHDVLDEKGVTVPNIKHKIDIRKVTITYPDKDTKEIIHIHCPTWQDYATIPYEVTALILEHAALHANGAPIPIHCSAGIGRTGALCLSESIQHQLNTNPSQLNFAREAFNLRVMRPGMVQEASQLKSILQFTHTQMAQNKMSHTHPTAPLPNNPHPIPNQ